MASFWLSKKNVLKPAFLNTTGNRGIAEPLFSMREARRHNIFTRSLTVISWNKETYVRHSLFVKVFYLIYKLNVVDIFGLNDVDVLALGLHLCGKEAHVLVAMNKGVLGGDRLQFVAL